MESGIYRILNTVNGMIYVGQAFVFQKRWKNHKIALNLNNHSNAYLQSAWNKYGSHKFEFAILEYCEIERLIEREQYWMDTFKSADRTRGYNLAPAAGSCIGVKHSDETKAMWSEMRKGRLIHTEETKAKIGEASKKRIVSEATREKMRQAQLGKKHSEEAKAKRAKALIGNKNNKGGPMSDEHKAAISASQIGHSISQETKDKIAASNKGKVVSPETRARMAEAAKRRWAKNNVDVPA